MGRRIERWIADDGVEFSTQQEMILHELDLIDAREIELFLDGMDKLAPRRRVEYAKVLVAWQQFKNRQATESVVGTDQESIPELPTNEAEEYSDPGAPIKFEAILKTPSTTPHMSEEEEIKASFDKAPTL
jgi:hypothetical protein